MKRFLSIALVLALLCTGVTMAESGSLEKTEKRNLVEFFELYAYRKEISTPDDSLSDDENADTETEGVITPDYHTKQTGADFLLETSEGTIWANKNTLGISRMEFPILHMWIGDDGNADSEYYTHNAMLSLSALEYGADYNAGDYYSENGFNASTIAFLNAAAIFQKSFTPALYNDDLINLVGDGKSKAIYSGNYDYFLQGKRNGQGTDVLLYYVAVAR